MNKKRKNDKQYYEKFHQAIGALKAMSLEASEKFAPIYELLDWKWSDSTPGEDEILTEIEDKIAYIEKSYKDKSGITNWIESGGIVVGIGEGEEDVTFAPYIRFKLDFNAYI